MNDVQGVNTKESKERHPLLYERARVRTPFFWWLTSWWHHDPHWGEEGTVIRIEWDIKRGATLYTVLFGDSRSGVCKDYTGGELEFPE